MKKIVLSLAVVASMVALASCGGNKAAEADTVDTLAAEEVVAADSDSVVAAEATETVEGADTTLAVEAVEAAK